MAGYEPATDAQYDYISGLLGRLKASLDRTNTLTRKEASDIIEILKDQLEDTEPVATTSPSVIPTTLTVSYWERRDPPKYQGKPVVWRQYPNQPTHSASYNGVKYGWRWRCEHSSHKAPVIGGSQLGGWEQCIINARWHQYKFHIKEQN